MKRRLLLLVGLLLAITTPAFAHVRVTPAEAERGSTTAFSFRVPNEEAPARTIKVEIFFPDGAAFTTVTPGTVTGWSAAASATSVVWSGGTISGEDRVEFPLTLGPVPSEGDHIVFKVLQTYDNGEVARWIDVAVGGEEPPHPAPTVRLTGVAPTTSAVEAEAPRTTAPPAADDDDDDGGSNVGLILLLVATFFAAVGAGIGIGLMRKRAG